MSRAKTYNLYIGHNVGAKHTWESVDIASAVADHFSSFTLIPCVGTWERVSEATSLVIVVTTERRKNVFKSVQQLVSQLQQECIMVQQGGKARFISS